MIVPKQLSAQNITSLETYTQLNQSLPGEKVFLHIDRPNYLQGDTIWFKAYIWFGYNQMPDTISRILHVDLFNPSGRIEQTRKLLIQNGTSHGDFSITKSVIPGKYTLRAYTRWMQNSNTGEPFYQTVTIGSPSQNFIVECNPVLRKQSGNDSIFVNFRFFQFNRSGDFENNFNHKVNYAFKINEQLIDSGQISATASKKQILKYNLSKRKGFDTLAIIELSVKDDQLTYNNRFEISIQDAIDLQFFPEGGTLVNGLESKIAFKAIGTDGLSREVKGTIESDEANIVTVFESSHKGMGTFMLKPEADRSYFAHLLYNNRNYIIPLPIAQEKGCIMALRSDENANKLYLTLKYSHSEANTQKYIAGNTYGKIIFAFPFKTTEDSCRILIPSNLLPEGVLRLTVLDSNFIPNCERLIYVNKNQRFRIKIAPESISVGTRSKVSLQINTTKPDGAPLETELSLSIVDKKQIIKDSEVHGISAYKLLESELRGNIEDPDYYFRNDSAVNRNDLDLVLLTHGYRRFLNTTLNNTVPEFMPERSYDISGEIKKFGNATRAAKFNYRDINLFLFCTSDRPYFEMSKPDSLGRFIFSIPLAYGRPTSLLQATTHRGKPFYCNIFLNELVSTPVFKRTLDPQYIRTSPAIENLPLLQATRKTIISKAPWEGAMSATLGEITVTAKAKNWYQDFRKEAIRVADLDSLDPSGGKYAGLNELLVKEFGAKYHSLQNGLIKTVWLPVVSFAPHIGTEWYPVYVINGKTFLKEDEPLEEFYSLLDQLSVFPVNEIKNIMVLPPGNIASHYASVDISQYIRQSLVVIETYHDTFRGDPTGIKTFIVDGLDTPRAFYSPRYEGLLKDSPIFDGRATIYWNPSIKTDENGYAKVEFFTSDRNTDLDLIINGTEIISGNTGQVYKVIKEK